MASNYYTTGQVLPTGITSAEQVKEMQRQLNASGANLTVDGVWGPKTSAAYSSIGAGQNSGVAVQTGNAVSPWQTEAERKAANNAALAPYGLSADKSYNMFDANYNLIAPNIGMDGMGGVFDPSGKSSNQNFLQGTIGITRNQLAGTGLENVSDKALQNAYQIDRTFSNDLWVDPITGGISSAKSANSVSVGDIRKALSGLTGQQYVDAWGAAAPFVKPNYYDGATLDTSGMAARQQDLINSLTQQAMSAYKAATGTNTTNPTTGTENTPTAPSSGLDEDELRRYIESLLKAGGKW